MLKIQKNNLTWLNYAAPTTGELAAVKDDFGINQYVAGQLAVPIKRPKIEEYPGYLFLVLHFPVFNEKTRQTIPTELDFIMTPKAIVTIHQDSLPQLENFCHECSGNIPQSGEYFKSPGYLLYCILDKLIDSCLPMLDHITDHLDDVENKIFHGHEKEMLSEIAIVKRDIIDFRRTIKPQKSVLEILAKKASRFFGEDLDFIGQEVIGSNIRVWNTLDNHKERVEAIEDTNNSLLSNKTNNILKTLTLLSFITFPLSLVAATLAMNTPMPEFLGRPTSFWEVIVLMFLTTAGMFWLFKKKRWL